MKRIESSNNAIIKTLKRLARARRHEDRFILEGRKLVEDALAHGFALDPIVVADSFDTDSFPALTGASTVELGTALFRDVSSLESPDGILAVALRPTHGPPRDGVVAVAAGVRDPGNLGAIARVVEASGAAGLVVLKGSTDPFGPKAVRGSMGSILRTRVSEIETLDALDVHRRVALVPRGGDDYRTFSWRPPVAIVLGGEGGGLDDDVADACDARVSVPMEGAVESLNVATAAALVLYEAARRRG